MLYGFFGIFYLHFETYANFLVLFASLMLISKHPKIGLLVSSIALWLASQTFFLPTSILISDNQSVQFQAFGPGFYCWFGSIVLIAIATLVSSVFSMTNENNA
jgi:hypothetical protein